MDNGSAVVVLSGGQDSSTCLFWALDQFEDVRAVTFHYGQRHEVELECAKDVADTADVPHDLVPISIFKAIGAKTDGMLADGDDIEETGHDLDEDLPTTFLPGRNLMLLTAATTYALKHDALNVVTGVCQTDYSGYPDCRQTTMNALELALQLGTDQDRISIHTPLMYKDKADAWALADELGVTDTIVEQTHTCYEGNHDDHHEWGYGCGECPACELRKQGYQDWGARDG